jgi:hypothetical protein
MNKITADHLARRACVYFASLRPINRSTRFYVGWLSF